MFSRLHLDLQSFWREISQSVTIMEKKNKENRRQQRRRKGIVKYKSYFTN